MEVTFRTDEMYDDEEELLTNESKKAGNGLLDCFIVVRFL